MALDQKSGSGHHEIISSKKDTSNPQYLNASSGLQRDYQDGEDDSEKGIVTELVQS